jgi:hypothetical protein
MQVPAFFVCFFRTKEQEITLIPAGVVAVYDCKSSFFIHSPPTKQNYHRASPPTSTNQSLHSQEGVDSVIRLLGHRHHKSAALPLWQNPFCIRTPSDTGVRRCPNQNVIFNLKNQ